ncbi:long-chain fatty acid transport protein 4 isoform X1 [Drosophila innubila]|uniref:long-chain fatty acid transport protein 4 isoform X1 n=2 Tax=Drosophila innubila TaxID=198719 RepID=UPI00148C2D1A|nr:long-chain fatty acid transport protein 4 isoform X1 [Drosophila innubila]XP_034476925.1 long-chain fatty acid transport protein 4 isoform X1 [Drosophila innubila]XP_034476926.1 long-chain fatty acid transport protein 4 isoform X1 [Drosophila innubila]
MNDAVAPGHSPTALNSTQNLRNEVEISIEKVRHTSKPKSEGGFCRWLLFLLMIPFLGAGTGLLWHYQGAWHGLAALYGSLMLLLLVKPGWRWFYIAAVTTPRDTIALIAYIRVMLFVKRQERKNLNVGDIFEANVAQHPDKLAIVSESQQWTFRQLNEHANRVANVFHSHGYKKGDVVGLLLENRAEFVATWLGLSKIGVITPLINTNLRGASLQHSIKVGNCTALIYGISYRTAVMDIAKDLPAHVGLYQFNDETHSTEASDGLTQGLAQQLNALLDAAPKDKVAAGATRPDHQDKLVYIYTSGTTGLPKAAVITHSRYFFIAAGIHYALGFRDNDVFYTPLPLYHTAGGVMSMGQALLFGSTVVIRKKFSASGYFADCARFNCTIAQYIGEMARYILATPTTSHDRQHQVRMVFGNGLRPQIWTQFVERFKIAKVGEFYGATEGNANIMNNDSTVGAIGFVSRILAQLYPISVIRADLHTGEPIRNEKGLCELCGVLEPGVFIGKIVKGNPCREFLGYVDAKASSKKVVYDVFCKGDMAFISGDLLVADERGYLYFKDRTGDTFRWKGENVSTSEVEAQLSNLVGYKDTIVYGVSIPQTEGRAGMAAIYDPTREVNVDTLGTQLSTTLPNYARPIFLRFLRRIDLTGTFKLRKVELQQQGFNPAAIEDELFYVQPNGSYAPLTESIFQSIQRNEVRF